MAVLVLPPFRIYPDKSGQPLDNGFIYVGEPNQDPSTNPVAIYWDAGLTIPAANPVRTINGYANNNGSQGNIYAADDYSIRIADRNNVVLYSAATTSETGIGTIVLKAGDALIVEAGASIDVQDGAEVNIGSDTGAGVVVSLASNARFVGDLVPSLDGVGEVGIPSRRWLESNVIEANAVNVKAEIVNVNVDELLDDLILDSDGDGGRVQARRIHASNSTNSFVGTGAEPFFLTSTRGLTANDVTVLRTTQPSTDSDLLRLNARNLPLASARVTVSGGVATLSADSLNVNATVNYNSVTASMQIQLLQAVSTTSRVFVTHWVAGAPLIVKARMQSSTVVDIVFSNNAGSVADPEIVNVSIEGPGSVSGAASIVPLPF